MQQIIYELTCQHKVLGPATLVSGTLHCPFDHQRNQIYDVEVMEWQTKCFSCTFARWAGMSEANAKMFRDSHSRKNPGHNVTSRRIVNPLAEKTKEKLDAWRVLSQS